METVSLILHIVCICKEFTSYYIPAAAALGGPGPLPALALHPQHHGAAEAGAARQPPQQQPRQQGGDRPRVLGSIRRFVITEKAPPRRAFS